MIGFCDPLLLCHRAGDQSFADIMQIKQNANRAANLVRYCPPSRASNLAVARAAGDRRAEVSHPLRRPIGENIELGMVPAATCSRWRRPGPAEQVINLAVTAACYAQRRAPAHQDRERRHQDPIQPAPK
jgi:two-component system cell cycle sensor histidine kinase/response regulator CckA